MRCAKQTVIAIVLSKNGRSYSGTNHISNILVNKCPRVTGEGYEKCKTVCQQESHAEIEALKLAGENTIDATLYIIGHTRVCEECKEAADNAGIKEIIFINQSL